MTTNQNLLVNSQQLNVDNLFLIGMMGSWKSTVGKKLAVELNMQFIDTDDEIEEMTEMKVADIFEEFGEEKFRDMESAYFVEKTKEKGILFSTGGGIVLNKNNRKVMRENGRTILLDASAKTLAQRIHNTGKRPLLKDSDNLEVLLQSIRQERHPLYLECAQLIVETDNLEPSQVVNSILTMLESSIENY